MAQKSSPYALRVGYNQDWNTYFFAENKQEQINYLKRDKAIRDHFRKLLPDTVRLKIEHTKSSIFIYLYISEISLVLGENNEKIDNLVKELRQKIDNKEINLKINLIEIKNPYSHAQAIANLIKSQLEKRVRYQQILRSILKTCSKEREVKGIEIKISGRLGGSDVGQEKKETSRGVPFNTRDSNIEEGNAIAIDSYGVIGIQVSVCKGKIKKSEQH